MAEQKLCPRCKENPCCCGTEAVQDEREVFGDVFDEHPYWFPLYPDDD